MEYLIVFPVEDANVDDPDISEAAKTLTFLKCTPRLHEAPEFEYILSCSPLVEDTELLLNTLEAAEDIKELKSLEGTFSFLSVPSKLLTKLDVRKQVAPDIPPHPESSGSGNECLQRLSTTLHAELAAELVPGIRGGNLSRMPSRPDVGSFKIVWLGDVGSKTGSCGDKEDGETNDGSLG